MGRRDTHSPLWHNAGHRLCRTSRRRGIQLHTIALHILSDLLGFLPRSLLVSSGKGSSARRLAKPSSIRTATDADPERMKSPRRVSRRSCRPASLDLLFEVFFSATFACVSVRPLLLRRLLPRFRWRWSRRTRRSLRSAPVTTCLRPSLVFFFFLLLSLSCLSGPFGHGSATDGIVERRRSARS